MWKTCGARARFVWPFGAASAIEARKKNPDPMPTIAATIMAAPNRTFIMS
jgi:hypothetical protein